MKILVLGLGNELLSDDGVGVLAARALREELGGSADVVDTSLSGLALLDFFDGYDKAILIDAVQTKRCPPGTVTELTPADLSAVVAPSPHYAGLPELLDLAGRLEMDFPDEIRIFAVEVVDPHTIGGAVSDPVRRSVGEVAERVRSQVRLWREERVHA